MEYKTTQASWFAKDGVYSHSGSVWSFRPAPRLIAETATPGVLYLNGPEKNRVALIKEEKV
jgi:hypothetical protein